MSGLGSKFRAVDAPSQEELAREWDAVVALRHQQIANGRDVSIRAVLVPAILSESADLAAASRVLDVGCGDGYLTLRLAERFDAVEAIDPSTGSIELAREQNGRANIDYHALSVEALANSTAPATFDLVVANMVLMDTADLTSFLASCSRLSAPGGLLIATCLHPFFWPSYWGYFDEPWFVYDQEIFVRGPFRTSIEPLGVETTHAHRPLGLYVNTMLGSGYRIERIEELRPSAEVAERYPEPWRYPRYLLFALRRA